MQIPIGMSTIAVVDLFNKIFQQVKNTYPEITFHQLYLYEITNERITILVQPDRNKQDIEQIQIGYQRTNNQIILSPEMKHIEDVLSTKKKISVSDLMKL